MIDIHCHPLPGTDDGPESWEQAEALVDAAFADGTRTIVATPHVLREPWLNEDREALLGLLAELNRRKNGRPRVLPGCELMWCSDLLDLAERALGGSGPAIFLGEGRHLLVEFGPVYPRDAEGVVHELSLMGVTLVVAHPERTPAMMREPGLLEVLVERGAKAQVTAASLLGLLGRKTLAAAEVMWARGLVHAVASDAHGRLPRPAGLSAAREWVERQWGTEAVKSLFVSGPAEMISAPAGGGGA